MPGPARHSHSDGAHFRHPRISIAGRFRLASAVVFPALLLSASINAQTLSEFPLTDFSKSSVEQSEILSGGPPRDGIPPIDTPAFVDVATAGEWLKDDEPVIAFELDGEAKAYPLQILMYHEIVNDSVASVPVSVTFCPLCNSSIVFDRRVDGKVLDFGTTGRLRKSDLIMYDRQTETWWQQFLGIGIIGRYTDTLLNQFPSQIISFATFVDVYPAGKVLSKETGFQRPYGNNPYAGYDSIDSSPFLFRGDVDPRLPAMERVLSIPGPEHHTLVPLSKLDTDAIINTAIGEQPVVVIAVSKATSALDKATISESRLIPAAAAFDASLDGQTLQFEVVEGKVLDQQTRSVWNALGYAVSGKLAGQRLKQIDSGVHFAFAWLAFDPAAVIFAE